MYTRCFSFTTQLTDGVGFHRKKKKMLMVNVSLTKLVQTRLQGLSVGPNSPQTLSSLCLILSNELSPRLRIHIYFWSETVGAGFCTTQLSENLPVTNDSVETGVSPHACVPSSSSANKNISFASRFS